MARMLGNAEACEEYYKSSVTNDNSVKRRKFQLNSIVRCPVWGHLQQLTINRVINWKVDPIRSICWVDRSIDPVSQHITLQYIALCISLSLYQLFLHCMVYCPRRSVVHSCMSWWVVVIPFRNGVVFVKYCRQIDGRTLLMLPMSYRHHRRLELLST